MASKLKTETNKATPASRKTALPEKENENTNDILKSVIAARELITATPTERIRKFQNLLKFNDSVCNPKETIILEYYVNATNFSLASQFSEAVTLFFINLTRNLLDNCICKNMSLVDNIAQLNEFLASFTHNKSAENECSSSELSSETKQMRNYLQTGLFQVCLPIFI